MGKLGKLCEIIPGKTPSKASYSSGGDIKIVKFRDVVESGIVDYLNDEEGWIDSTYSDDSDLINLEPGSILLTNAAHSTEHIGKKVAFVESIPNIASRVCFVGELTSIRSKNKSLSTKWLFYWLQTTEAKKKILKSVEGAHLVPREFRKIEVPKISEDEQEKQLALMETADEAIAKAKCELDATQVLKRSLLTTLFSEGLQRPKGMYRSKWVVCPAHWKIKPLKKIAGVTSGFTMGRNLSRYETITIPYVTVINVQDGRFELNNISSIEIKKEELDTDVLKYGDILMTEGGDRDKLGRGGMWRDEITPCSYQNHIFRVRLNSEEYMPELFHFLIQTYQAKNYFYSHAKQTSNLCTINSRELKNWPVSIPPPKEQVNMVEFMRAAEQQETAMSDRLYALENLKRSLLENLLTGRIRIP